MPVIKFNHTDEQRDVLEAAKAQTGMSKTELIHNALAMYLPTVGVKNPYPIVLMRNRVGHVYETRVVAGNLRRIRERKGLSPLDLSEMVDVSAPTIYNIERNAFETVAATTVEDLAQALGVGVDELIKEM